MNIDLLPILTIYLLGAAIFYFVLDNSRPDYYDEIENPRLALAICSIFWIFMILWAITQKLTEEKGK